MEPGLDNRGAEGRPVIIKKIKKVHGGGHHGGAWKVAYADFVTAMMALFMVLWLVATMSIDAKKAVGDYFRSYTIFRGNEAGGAKGVSMMTGNPVMINTDTNDLQGTGKDRNKLALELGKIMESSLRSLQDNLLIYNTNDGVRIEMVDREKSTMFKSGGAELMDNGRRILKVIASILKDMPYTLSIEGHTDSHAYTSENYTNWELASDRANAARRELVRNGLDSSRITKVSSFADASPLNSQDPFDPTNRRISILLHARW